MMMNTLSSNHKPLSHLLHSRTLTLYISLFSTSSSSSSSSSRRQWEEESRNVRVSVWWDLHNCRIPEGTNVFKVAQFITQAIRTNGIKGPVQISAFGDFGRKCRSTEEAHALSLTGVNLLHIPPAIAEGSILMNIMYWVSQNPPPAHIFLISSDRSLASVLHRLRMNNYNILLASVPSEASPALCSASSIMWNWNELTRGDNLSGRRFNQPPDGPFNSWYGQYRGPLEDPFEMPELKRPAKANDSSDEEVSSEKVQSVPMAVLKEIRRIVSSYPNGVSSNELRYQLRRSQVDLVTNYYGYKKFTCFLLSIPHIVNAVPSADGVVLVRPVSSNARQTTESFTSTNGIQEEVQLNAETSDTTHSTTKLTEIEPMLPVSSKVAKEEAAEENVAETSEKVLKETSGQVDENPAPEQNLKSVTGFFRRLWTKWFRGNNCSVDTEKRKHDIHDEFHAPNNIPEESTSNEGSSKSTNQDSIRTASSSSSGVLSMDAKSTIIDKSPVKSPLGPSYKESHLIEDSNKCMDSQNARKDTLKSFHDESFWNAIKSFLKTSNGSQVLLKSKSREEFARRLHFSGMPIVQSLQESDLLHVVDVLVSDKKWVTEHPSKNPRFRITLPLEKSSGSSQPHQKNGLSSLFSNSSDENPRSRVSSIVKKSSRKSRVEILGDCKKLLDEVLKEHPGGFNLGLFREHFELKYGYPLDYQKLGYPKLMSLLQIMPGVKIECGQVFPDSKNGGTLGNETNSSSSDSEIIDPPRNHEDVESSSWEELGPVSEKSDISKQEMGSDQDRTKHVYEEPCASEDDELSDPDEEEEGSPMRTKEEDQNRSRLDADESSLLQILDSWYSSNDGNSPPRARSSDVESSEECGDKHEITAYHTENQRRKKKYVFVSESEENQRQSDQSRVG